MWFIAQYRPVGMFSLKHSLATASGGKSLLVPTPYAFKMALLDAACRLWGVSRAQDAWPTLRDLKVALRPPTPVVVTNLFTRVLKRRRRPAASGSPDAGPLGKTIAFREYVWFGDDLNVAIELSEADQSPLLTELVSQINYLGKRGGFIQLMQSPTVTQDLPDEFVPLNLTDNQQAIDSRGLLQMLDDCSPKMTFEHANIYSSKRVSLGKQRLLNHVVLPYRLIRSSKSYSLYERIEAI